MFQSLILPMKIGISYGSGALKALQNDNIPELDLLVREAVQNSSDAAIDQPGDSCNVNFTQGTFCPHAFNSLLPDIGAIMDRRFAESTAEYLEIRDYNTSGLTGPIRQKDLDPQNHGNYFKLIFDTGKEQTNSSAGEAGGSWGYGKSVYYRVGIGLVIFYTRIRENGILKSRLIISFIEDETDRHAVLKEIIENSVGRAWWGKRIPGNDDEILPLTDESEIQRVLDIFSLKPFQSDKTGTAIIIPYIDKKRLLKDIFPKNCGIPVDEIKMCRFKDDVSDYIRLAVQKWYAPRIYNKELRKYSKQKWLGIRVNKEPIRDDNMHRLFRLIQELYTSALSADYGGSERYKSKLFPFIKCVQIPSRKLDGNQSGYAAYIRITKDELWEGSSAIEPYTYLRLFGKASMNDPVVMFARTPGMILDYKIDDKWAKGLAKPENDGEYLFVFYVPNCEVTLKDDSSAGQYAGKPFGEYLRKVEKSDHMDWTDLASFTLISNIKSQICNKVNEDLRKDGEKAREGKTSGLSVQLGKRLLPTLGFGQKQKAGGSGTGGGGGSVNNFKLTLGTGRHDGNKVVIDFSADFSNAKRKAVVGVFVESETGLMDFNSWEKYIGTEYPITIDAVRDCKTVLKDSGKEEPIPCECNFGMKETNSKYTTIRILTGDDGTEVCGLEIENKVPHVTVTGKLVVRTVNRKYRCVIKETKKFDKN